MMENPGQLPIPDQASDDARAVELVRIWATHGQQEIIIASEAWDDPAAWGILLVDLARHVGAVFASKGEYDFDAAMRRIKEGFDAEWNQPLE